MLLTSPGKYWRVQRAARRDKSAGGGPLSGLAAAAHARARKARQRRFTATWICNARVKLGASERFRPARAGDGPAIEVAVFSTSLEEASRPAAVLLVVALAVKRGLLGRAARDL